MRLLKYFSKTLWSIGFFGNGILFLYIEWTYLHENPSQIFNLNLHLNVLENLLFRPFFWIFIGIATLGFCTNIFVENQSNKKDNSRSEKGINTSKPYPEIKSTSPSTALDKSIHSPKDTAEEWYKTQEIKLLEWAIENNQKIKFSYSRHEGNKSDRTVTPIGFQTVDKALYFQGYCHLRHSQRMFDVKRITGIRTLLPDVTGSQSQSSSESTSTQTRNLSSNVLYEQPSSPQTTGNVSRVEHPTQRRKYIRCRFDEIEAIAKAEWNNVRALSSIHHELGFRTRRKPKVLRERIEHRLGQLQNSQSVWPSTTVASGSHSLSSNVFRYEKGLLSQKGYKVGTNGLSEDKRRQILNSIFLQPLSFVDDASYLQEWGKPRTAQRLKKIAESIAAFTRNAKRRNKSNLGKAIQDWEADLAYLKQTYYDGDFNFPWPRTDHL